MRHTYLLLAAIPVLTLVSCHDDDSTPLVPIKEKTYTGTSLELFSNGQPMPSKSVTFIQDGDKARVSAYSLFDLSQIAGMGLEGEVPAPGAVPGAPRIEWNVGLTQADGAWAFSGKGTEGVCSYSYQGYATSEKMRLYLTDVRLLAGAISPSVWQPAPISKEADGSYKSLPFYIDWQYDPIPGVDLDLAPFVDALATLPIIPVYGGTAYMSVAEALHEVVKTAAFLDDGNMIFTYVSSAGGAYQIDQTLPNRFQYAVVSPSEVRLYLDPMSLFGLYLVNASGGTPADKVNLNDHGLFPADGSTSEDDAGSASALAAVRSEITASALKYFMPRMAEGLPLAFKTDGSALDLYIDTDMAVDLFNNIIIPVLGNDTHMAAIMRYISSLPELKPLLPQLEKALKLLPEAFLRTNTLRLGVALVPFTSGTQK